MEVREEEKREVNVGEHDCLPPLPQRVVDLLLLQPLNPFTKVEFSLLPRSDIQPRKA
jgi:hypothetical protein